ncbi:hypothetical protein A2U01_0069656, partial [Trifolium medium]|nr:hypothetical protein [Trifolium medium]
FSRLFGICAQLWMDQARRRLCPVFLGACCQLRPALGGPSLAQKAALFSLVAAG